MGKELEIPEVLKVAKPAFTAANDGKSSGYVSEIMKIIDWAEEVDSYFFFQEFDSAVTSAAREKKEFEAYKYLFMQDMFPPELPQLLDLCHQFRPKLTILEFAKFLNITPRKVRGRPRGMTMKTIDLNNAVEHYKRLRDIIHAEYNIYSKDILADYISKFWAVKIDDLVKQASRPKSRSQNKR